jgi:FixJ family two-component response regulator
MVVYVIDDDPSVNDALTTLIRQLGHDVVSYPDATALFGRVPPTSGDIVFIDLKLPGITGGEAIRWLQRLKDPPRIVPISALSREFIQRQLEGTGMQVLRKPLDYAGLLAALSLPN